MSNDTANVTQIPTNDQPNVFHRTVAAVKANKKLIAVSAAVGFVAGSYLAHKANQTVEVNQTEDGFEVVTTPDA